MISHETLDRQRLSVSSMERTGSSTASELSPLQQDEEDVKESENNANHKDGVVSSPETASHTNQEKETVATTTAQSTVASTDIRKMKLIVRSQYWGKLGVFV
jgi:hypothetical protein